jgi:nuclear protein localization protein 4 homolog
LTVVPIVQHTSEMLVAEFPRANRDFLDERTQSHEEMKKHLQKSGTAGWTFTDRLADFNLLIYLSKFLDVNADFPKICASIVDRSVPLDDGYKLIIKSMAGMDGSY